LLSGERTHDLLLYTARREAHSLVEMVSEGVASASVIVVSRVIDVFSVGLSVWVAIRREVSIVGEEETVPCAMLLGLSVLLVTIGLILSFEHGSFSNVELILRDHSGEGLEVRASEPGILQNV
jgi:hypothetical protein